MSAPVIFISYSHKDKDWMERLLVKFALPKKMGLCDVWTDQQIPMGEDWESKIDEVLKNARVAIILVSDNFLASEFIVDKEVPRLLERREKGELYIIPIIADSCVWEETLYWLKKIEVRPKEGSLEEKEIADWRRELTNIAKEILSRFGSAPNSQVTRETQDIAKPPSSSKTSETKTRLEVVGQVAAVMQKDPALEKDLYALLRQKYGAEDQAESSKIEVSGKKVSQKTVRPAQATGPYSKSRPSKL